MADRKVDASRFAMVPRSDVPRSSFDVRYTHKTSLGPAVLAPIYVDEVLPGDSLRLNLSVFARLATLIVPVMDNLYLETFFFFVPNRLLWDNWQRFMGERLTPADTTQFVIPQLTVTDVSADSGTVANWFGLQKPAAGQTYNVSALPFRAYNLIWNEFFRDQDLINPVTVPTDDGPDTIGTYGTLFRGKRHDYFTSARPWPQKTLAQANTSGALSASGLGIFQPGQDMTFGTWGAAGAPVTGIGFNNAAVPTAIGSITDRMTGARVVGPINVVSTNTASVHIAATETGSGSGMFPDVRVLVNDIRTAVQIQNILEQMARGGTRYVELLRSIWGVSPPDFRLQRPEYLGGGRSFVNINPVAQTSESSGSGKLGELGATGTSVATRHGFTASFTEHGFIIGLASIRADLTYQAGVNRMWRRRTVFDHYQPGLAHLGEQAVLSSEIYADGSSGDDAVFGYQERWAEYRYKPSMTTGVMNSYHPTPLDVWHFAQKFTSRPSLNEAFINEQVTGVLRPLEVDVLLQEAAIADLEFNLRWVRPLPMYSIPGLGARL